MSLRMVDFRCENCGTIFEEVVSADKQEAYHCGRSNAVKVWLSAPGIDYKRRYSHGLGKVVSSYAEEERGLAQKNMWIASKNEANNRYDTDHFRDNVTVRNATKERTKKHVEKAAARLAKEGFFSKHGIN